MTFRTIVLLTSLCAAAAAAGCGTRTVGGAAAEPAPPATEPPAPVLAKSVIVELVLDPVRRTSEAHPPRHRVYLSLTDETGASTQTDLGVHEGACTPWSPEEGAADPYARDALLGLRCWHAGAGVQLRVVRRQGQLIVLRAPLDEHDDEVHYEESKRVTLPAGADVRVSP